MRRPGLTRQQKQHAREQRALLVLRRASVRYSILMDAKGAKGVDLETECAFAFAELGDASDKYTEAIGFRAQCKLVGLTIAKLRSVA